MASVSGLLMRHQARKDTAEESYQQIAESAAANGFNRILGTLNNDTSGEYLGYLYRINSDQSNDYNWDKIPLLEEPCAAKNNTVPAWLLSKNNLEESIRSDELGDLKAHSN